MSKIQHEIEMLRQRIDAQRTLTRTQWVLLRHDVKQQVAQGKKALRIGKRVTAVVTGLLGVIRLAKAGFRDHDAKDEEDTPKKQIPWWRRFISLGSIVTSGLTIRRWINRLRR